MIQPLTSRALDRRVKSWKRSVNPSFFLSVTPGLESVATRELNHILPGVVGHAEPGGIAFESSLNAIWSVNESVLSANRLLLRLDSFMARSYPEFFQKCKRIPWEVALGAAGRCRVDISCSESRLHHTDNLEKSLREAIHQYYSQWEPDTPISGPDLPTIFIRFHRDICTVSLDTSGDLLYQRGYRLAAGLAPIRDSIAAAMLIMADATQYPVILDPFCGTGPFLFEMRRLLNPVPSSNWRSFPFTSFPFYHEPGHRKWNLAVKTGNSGSVPQLIGSDNHPEAIRKAMENDQRQNMQPPIRWMQQDVMKLTNSWGDRGLLVTNPPWGDRISTGAAGRPSDWVSHLATAFPGWDLVLIYPEQLPGFRVLSTILTGGKRLRIQSAHLLHGSS